MIHFENDLRDGMLRLPAGTERIRDFQDVEKWMSVDSKMAIPGRAGNKRETVHDVEIKPFSMLQFPVTADMYNCVMNGVSSESISGLPMTNVSWNEAVRFCNALSSALGLAPCYGFDDNMDFIDFDPTQSGYRLPTDAEWQYACRAGSAGYRYGELGAIAWYQDNSFGHAHAVGGKQSNAWGLHDMIGNVWEWCWDVYDAERYGDYRIFRGGSFAEAARGCGATCRRRSVPDFKIDDLGFRIART